MKYAKNFIFLCLIIFVSFILPRLIPGSPLFLYDSDVYVLNTKLPQETFNMFEEYYAPNKSIVNQLFIYLKNIMSLDLGFSFYYNAPVKEIILGRIKWTILLSGFSILISSSIAIPLGLNISMSKSKDIRANFLKNFIIIQAIPIFILAIILQLILSFKLNIFPSSGAYTIGANYNFIGFILDILQHITLPLLVLVISSVPSIFILTYNLCMRTKNENFVKNAYYCCIDEKIIKYQYILKNSLPEILSKLNIHFLYVISGTMFVEVIFSYPGMGTLLRISTLNNDYPLVQGILLITGIYGIIINLFFEKIIEKVSSRF